MRDVVGPFDLNARTQRWFAISGFVSIPLIAFGLALARVLPPHSATWSAERIVGIYAHDHDRIQLGCVLMMVGFALWGWWQAVLTLWVWRMESRQYPILTFASLILVPINTMVVEMMSLSYAVTAFRAGHIAPEITLAFNDLSWFLYYYTWPPFVLWLVVVAISMFRDKHAPQIFPRWVAWLTLLHALICIPNLFQTFSWALVGPLAWDGWWTNGVVASVGAVWNVVIVCYMLNVISREERGLMQPPLVAGGDELA